MKPSSKKKIFAKTYILLIPALCFSACFLPYSCGKKDSGGSPQQVATSTPIATSNPTTSPTATPIPYGVRDFWVGNTNNRIVARYDANGSLKSFVDLQSLSVTGGVTAIEYLDSSNMIVVLDPGADGGESLVAVNPITSLVKSATWYKSSATYDKVTTENMVSSALAGSLLVPTGTAIERLIYNNNGAFRLVAPDGTSPYISALGSDCPMNKVSLITGISDKKSKFLAVVSAGTVGRINIVNGLESVPKCISSFDYTAAGQPTKSTHVPSSATQMSDGKLYVLYQDATAPMIVRYTFNGTSLESPEVVFADSSILGSLPKGLTQRTATSLLVGNTNADKIFEISFSGAYTGFFIQSTFSIDVAVLKSVPK